MFKLLCPLSVCAEIAELAMKYQHLLTSDEGAKYDQVIEINLDEVNLCNFTLHFGLEKGRKKNKKGLGRISRDM